MFMCLISVKERTCNLKRHSYNITLLTIHMLSAYPFIHLHPRLRQQHMVDFGMNDHKVDAIQISYILQQSNLAHRFPTMPNCIENKQIFLVNHYSDVIMSAAVSQITNVSCLFRRRSKKTSKVRVTGLCEGDPLVTGGFPSQKASNAALVSIWRRLTAG